MSRVFRLMASFLVGTVLILGSSARASGISWEDVGRVAAFVVTSGWSEIVFELIRSIDATRDNIRKQLDGETKLALQDVTNLVQAQRQIVVFAEARVNAALQRGRLAHGLFASRRVPVDERDTQKLAGRATQYKGPLVTQNAGKGSLGAEGKAQPAVPNYGTPMIAGQERDVTARDQRTVVPTVPPADLALLRDAMNKLETVARDFRHLATAIRRELDLGKVKAEAHVTEINSEVTNQFIGPLNGIRAAVTIEQILFGPDGARYLEIFNRRMGAIVTAWDNKAVTIRTSITGAVHERVSAADAGRTTAIADWTERFAELIEAATGMQTRSRINAGQAQERLKTELNISTVPPLNLRQAATSKVGNVSTDGGIRTDVTRPGTGTGQAAEAIKTSVGRARQLFNQLEGKRAKIDSRLLTTISKNLQGEFKGKTPSEVTVRRDELRREAKQRFASDAKVLQIVDRMITFHTQGTFSGAAGSLPREVPSTLQRR